MEVTPEKNVPRSTPSVPPRARKRRAPWRGLMLYAGAAALVAGLVYAFWPKPVDVDVARVTRGALTVSVLEEGQTRIRHRHDIFSPVAGFLNRVELREGAPIKAGETVLATVQPQASEFLTPRAKAVAEARLKAAEAAEQLRRSELARVRESLDLAQKDLARMEELRSAGVISRQEFDVAENRSRVLTRELNAAEFAIRVAAFEVEQARAALMQAQSPEPEQAAPIRIMAPVDGYVLNVHEESARVIDTMTPIMEVGDPTDLEAEIELLSSDAVAVKPGADVVIEHWGGEGPLRGRVSLVEPGGFTKISALGVEEQRVRVRVELVDAPPAGTTLGDRYRVEARIVTWQSENVLQAPIGALFRKGNDWMTYVVSEGRAALRKVEIDHNNGIAAEVLSGLTEGEIVILYPPDSLRDGTGVVIEAEETNF